MPGESTEPTQQVARSHGWLKRFPGRFFRLRKEGIAKTLLVALVTGLLGGIVVSLSTNLLRPLQEANEQQAQQKKLLAIVRAQPGMDEFFDHVNATNLHVAIVDLAPEIEGERLGSDIHGASVDKLESAPAIAIPPEEDVARIKEVPRYSSVYLVHGDRPIEMIILPVYGKGYASMLRGFIGLDGDLNTVIALSFHNHAESPGMGARIDDPAWLAQWRGKKVRDREGNLRLGVAHGAVAQDARLYQVDGISGATSTSRGVHNLLRFWLGDYGFGPYLSELKASQPE